MTDTTARNVSINCQSKNDRYKIDCYISHITIDNYYYLLSS